MLKKTIFFVIMVSLIFCTILPLKGYSEDDWVKYFSNDNVTLYYKPSSVKFYNNENIFKVELKFVYTEIGKDKFLNQLKSDVKPKYLDFNHTIYITFYNYKEMESIKTHTTLYSKSGVFLDNFRGTSKWERFYPGDSNDTLMNIILKENNIQR